MKPEDWALWLHPMTPPVIEALKAWDEAWKRWRSVAPPRMTASRAHVKLLAWTAGATLSDELEPEKYSPEQIGAAVALADAKKRADFVISEAVGPWMPASAIKKTPEGVPPGLHEWFW